MEFLSEYLVPVNCLDEPSDIIRMHRVTKLFTVPGESDNSGLHNSFDDLENPPTPGVIIVRVAGRQANDIAKRM